MTAPSLSGRGQFVLFIGGPEAGKVHWIDERTLAGGTVVVRSRQTREFEARDVTYRRIKITLGTAVRVCFAPEDMSKDSVDAAVTSYLARAYDTMLKGIASA